ncbi:MAG: glycosyl hydrolase 53 family protein [Thaumarchaeota archaeon]|nr:glycosyl hydrolase 53 family protein [Nitrososphaerota archaeon]MCL5319004.1 glycosyl hydrolase 53 family protein [Nitrososphaerota archaeon]
MKRRTAFVIALVIIAVSIVVVGGIFLTSLTQSNSPTTTTTPSFQKGVTLSPQSFQQSNFTDFFTKAKQAGSIVSWVGDWNELGDVNGGSRVVAELASTYGYTPVVETQFFTQSTGRLLRPLDDATKQSYKSGAVAFAEKYRPKYLALGVEPDMLYEKSPADFDQFAKFYSEVYDAVKAVSPNTKVFTIFQLEQIKGLKGGLFGGVNDPSKAQWQLLDRFPKNDLIAFTTYPGFIYKNPSDIPADYYTEIKSHTSKPVMFTEIGWHSAPSPSGWESSETKQAEFINRFYNLTKNLNKETVIWAFMYDQKTIAPFNSMGLLYNNGTAKLAWNAWLGSN